MVLAIAATADVASADDMDIALARLRVASVAGSDCSPTTSSGNRAFCADAEAWGRLMAELGGSVLPTVDAPARTLGYRGLSLSAQASITGISSDAEYWQLGTEGDAESAREGRNRFPSSVLTWSRVNVRKGFPFGLELGASVGHLLGTSLWSTGLELKWAIIEGFRTGVGAVVPDIAIRGAVQTIHGDGEFNLSAPSIDVVASKRLVLSNVATLTPFASVQLGWVYADSELVDLTPEVDAFERCDPEPGPPGAGEGVVRCRGDGSDYNNNAVFPRIRAARYRLHLGAQGAYQAFTYHAAIAFDVLPPSEADGDVPSDVSQQWTATIGIGLSY